MSFNLLVVGGWDTDWCTLRSWENKILSERKNSSFQISNFRASSREEPRHGEERNSEVSRGSEQCQSRSSHCPPAGAQRRPICQWMILDPDSYQPIPSPPTSPILYFPPSHSTNIVLFKDVFTLQNKYIHCLYSCERSGGGSPPLTIHWVSKDDKVHIFLGWSEDRNISQLLKVVKSTWEGFIWQ